MTRSKVPQALRTSLAALALLAGLGGGAYVTTQAAKEEAQHNEYVQAVATDRGTSDAVKIAMVMGHYYESSNRHIGTPYIDKVGKGRPLTVCNGVTGAGVVAGKYYTPSDCYRLERARYVLTESKLARSIPRWSVYSIWVQATTLDFVYNVGEAAFMGSTMRRKLDAGDVIGACRENPRWNKGTVNGVLTVLPGLVSRRTSNAEICEQWG